MSAYGDYSKYKEVWDKYNPNTRYYRITLKNGNQIIGEGLEGEIDGKIKIKIKDHIRTIQFNDMKEIFPITKREFDKLEHSQNKETKMDDFIKLNIYNVTKRLNVEKIKTLEDVKRVLEFLDIKITVQEGLTNPRYEKVKDLFE